jgi:hypothetical protein
MNCSPRELSAETPAGRLSTEAASDRSRSYTLRRAAFSLLAPKTPEDGAPPTSAILAHHGYFDSNNVVEYAVDGRKR